LAAARDLYPDICIGLLREELKTARSWKFPADTPIELVVALTERIERAMGKVLEEFSGANKVKRGVKRKIEEVER